MPSSFAENSNAHRLQVNVVDSQSRQFGYAKAGANGQMQHGPIANPIAGRRIGCVEQGLELLSQEVGNQTRVGFLERDRQNATYLLKRRRLTIFEEVEEGLDCRQPNVTGFRRVFARVLQIFEEASKRLTPLT